MVKPAIEIRNLSKSFHGLYAVDHLNMTVPVGTLRLHRRKRLGQIHHGEADRRSFGAG